MYNRRKLCNTVKYLTVLLIVAAIHYSIVGYNIPDIHIHSTPQSSENFKYVKTRSLVMGPDSEDKLLITPFCTIPNYAKSYEIPIPRDTPKEGERAVRISMTGPNLIEFHIDSKEMFRYVKNKTFDCCYVFVKDVYVEDGRRLFRYTYCAVFKNATKVDLKYEVIIVFCGKLEPCKKMACLKRAAYTDVYIFVKNQTEGLTERPMLYNVLLLGIESMSRARAYATLPRTVDFLNDNAAWLDYRANHRTVDKHWQMLSGKHQLSKHSICNASSNCSPRYVWSRFMDADYFTASGENIPLTGNLQSIDTHHYMRLFFKTRQRYGISKTTVFANLLNYAENFATTYKNHNFFGTFWLNDVKKNVVKDRELRSFLERLDATGVLENTFIILYSNAGVVDGDARVPVEGYYDERLPMLFVWSPPLFQQLHQRYHLNMETNQHRLTTHQDVLHSLEYIFTLSSGSPRLNYRSNLLREISILRSCLEAQVEEEFCACQSLTKLNIYDHQTKKSVNTVVNVIQSISRTAETVECMECARTKLQKVLRVHSYVNTMGLKFHVVAVLMAPQSTVFESILQLDEVDDRMETMLIPELVSLRSISEDQVGIDCVRDKKVRPYCACALKENCSWA